MESMLVKNNCHAQTHFSISLKAHFLPKKRFQNKFANDRL